jgi:hypothetical protein
MPTESRSDDETTEELQIQLHLLSKACHEFDNGDLHETRNVARALRVLLTEDAHGDPPLIERAGHAEKLFPDTRSLTHPRNILPQFSLTGVVLGTQTIGARALLEDAEVNAEVPYRRWREQIFADDREGNIFSRHRLIKAVANLAGGTHFPSDIRNYYRKLEQVALVGRKDGEEVEVPLRDLEKHSLRQIAFEILRAFERTDGRGVRAEPGATLYRSFSLILYPGRKVHTSVQAKMKQTLVPFANSKEHGLDSVGGLPTKLPYEGTRTNAPCPCSSGLRFKRCCAVPHDFDAVFIDAFERRHSLGKYDNGIYWSER